MIFEGFEGPFSQSKSIKNRFQVELAMKCAPRRPQDVSRRPQDAPKTPQDSQDGPKTRPRRPQDAPRTPQDAPQGAGTVAGTRLCRAKDFRNFRIGLNKQSEKFEALFVSFVSIGFRFDPALK